MSRRQLTRNRFAFFAVLIGLVCEAAALLPFVTLGPVWFAGQGAFILHGLASLYAGFGAAYTLTSGRGILQITGPALIFILLIFTIPVAGLVAVLLLTVILLAHQLQRRIDKPELTPIHDPSGPARRSPNPIADPLVTLASSLSVEDLRETILGMKEMPAGQTRGMLKKFQKHSDVRVQLYASGLLNDQVEADERRLATLEERGRDTPRDLPTLLAIVESYLRLIDQNLLADDEIPHTAQHACHAAAATLAVAPRDPIALQAMVRFQLLLNDFHGAYGTILRLHQLAGQKPAASDLLARLSYDYATSQPVVSTPPPFPPHARVRARLS